MTSIIVLDNKADQKNIEQTLATAQTQEGVQLLLLSNESASNTDGQGNIEVVSLSDNSLGKDIQNAMDLVQDENVLFIDSRMPLSSEQLSSVLSQSNSMNEALGFCSYNCDGEVIEMPSISAEALVSLFSRNSEWPFMMVAAKSSYIRSLKDLDATTSGEFFLKAVIRSIPEGEAIQRSLSQFSISNMEKELIQQLSFLSKNEIAESTRLLINTINIEELFPNHSWEMHGNESAAASYHTLTALFIKLEDLDSAIECLSLGDQLEDSPRSLALKGLIALSKGETLAAVANMVSSLQEYEKRKGDKEDKHYLKFAPKNLEVINSQLQSGLEALNKRDNDGALNHFADAVFNFDQFYEECGLSIVRSRMN